MAFNPIRAGLVPAVALATVSACATTTPASPPGFKEVAEQSSYQSFLAMRDFQVRSAPSMEADYIGHVPIGSRFDAAADLDPDLDWRYIRFADGLHGYVFGKPFEIAKNR